MSSDRPLEGLEADKEEAKALLLKGLDPSEVARSSPLSLPQIPGLKGSLVRAGLLEGKKTRASKTPDRPSEDPSDPLPTERDTLREVLLTAGVPKKKLESVLDLTDYNSYDVEGLYAAMGDANLSRSLKNTALKLYSRTINEEIPDYILDELKTSQYFSRERGRGQYLTRDDLESFYRKKEEKTGLQRLEEKVDKLLSPDGGLTPRAQPGVRYREIRVPIDAAGRPTDPSKATSVRYERIYGGGGDDGQYEKLLREIQTLKDGALNDRLDRIEDAVGKTGSDIGLIVGGVKDILTSWSESEGGPLARAASPLVDAFGRKVLANYEGMGVEPIPPNLENVEPTPPALVERLREHGLVSRIMQRRGGQ